MLEIVLFIAFAGAASAFGIYVLWLVGAQDTRPFDE